MRAGGQTKQAPECPSWQDVLFYFQSHRGRRGPRVIVPAHLESQAKKRFEVVAPLLDFDRHSRPLPRTQEGITIRSKNEMVSHLAKTHGFSQATIWRWHGRFRSGGYAALANEMRSDSGISRRFDNNLRVRSFVEEKYLGSRLSIASTHRELVRAWPALCPNSVISPPGRTTIRDYLNSLPRPVVVLARHGRGEFRRLCGDQYGRLVSSVRAFAGSTRVN
jgi:hypothetical protein